MAHILASSDVFVAISDPTRRAILDALREGERTAGELFRGAASAVERMSQPAFSQHLAVLREAGLVSATRRKNFRVYRLEVRPLAAVVDWAAHYDRFWDEKLDGLERFVVAKSRQRKMDLAERR